ncbi:MAG: hypothetical protein NVS1B10_08970 [Candidatus Saccharimonadales bacterium]
MSAPSKLDGNQILRHAFNDATGLLQTSATLTASSAEVVILQTDDSIQTVPFRGTVTDRSGVTSATPNTSTQVVAINASRKYFFIQNLDSTNDIFINLTTAASTTAGTSIRLPAKAAYVMESGFISTEAINVVSATASVSFVAKEG